MKGSHPVCGYSLTLVLVITVNELVNIFPDFFFLLYCLSQTHTPPPT